MFRVTRHIIKRVIDAISNHAGHQKDLSREIGIFICGMGIGYEENNSNGRHSRFKDSLLVLYIFNN